MPTALQLVLFDQLLAIVRLPAGSPVPDWVTGNFTAVVCTPDEVSLVCPSRCVPAEMQQSTGWQALKVRGPLDFSLVGILASLVGPLAEQRISIFAISTFDTDYLLIQSADVERAVDVLVAAGHEVTRENTDLTGVRR